MNYQNIVNATFIKRPNRFIAHCQIGDEIVIAHVKNTGRCQEILIPGAAVYLEHAPSPSRKTDYSLIAVIKHPYLINIDSQIPNAVAFEGIQNGKIRLPGLGEITTLRREVTYGNSRFDLYVETESEKAFVEIKGVTLEEDGIVKFPDAPTTRGTKHLYEMIAAKEEGYKAYVLFVIQMKSVKYFTPNEERDPHFAKALHEAKAKGVEIVAYDCYVQSDALEIGEEIEVRL